MQIIFAYPQFWYALLAVPLALFLAFLARRERRVTVTSLLPWRAVLALPRPKPSRNPLDLEMLCAILIPCAIAFALLGGALLPPKRKLNNLSLVVDTSLSMSSRGHSGRSRAELVRDWLKKIFAAHPDLSLTLYCTQRPEPLVTNGSLAEVLNALSTSGTAVQTTAEARSVLANALRVTNLAAAPVVWLSDRAAPLGSPRLSEIIVGEAASNIAITVARLLPTHKPPACFVVLANFGQSEQTFPLEWHWKEGSGGAKVQLGRRKITLAAGAYHTAILPLGENRQTGNKQLVISLGDWRDDLSADNQVTISLGSSRSVAIDKTRFSRATIALREAAGLKILPLSEAVQAAFSLTDTEPATARKRVFLYAPTKAVCGLVTLGEKRTVRDARIVNTAYPLPEIAIEGLGTFTAYDVTLPPGATVLATARAGDKVVPLVAFWTWRNTKIAYLAAAPKSWTRCPGYPVMLAEITNRLLPPKKTLPGNCESDNRLRVAATRTLPKFFAGVGSRQTIPLGRWLVFFAAVAGGYVAWREWSRIHVARQL